MASRRSRRPAGGGGLRLAGGGVGGLRGRRWPMAAEVAGGRRVEVVPFLDEVLPAWRRSSSGELTRVLLRRRSLRIGDCRQHSRIGGCRRRSIGDGPWPTEAEVGGGCERRPGGDDVPRVPPPRLGGGDRGRLLQRRG
jgi:hypothetical protein